MENAMAFYPNQKLSASFHILLNKTKVNPYVAIYEA